MINSITKKLALIALIASPAFLIACGDSGSDTVVIERETVREVEKDDGNSFSLSIDEDGKAAVEIRAEDK